MQLVFANQEQQQLARQLLLQQGRDAAAITLEFHANAPSWLLQLGAAPIKLGLDLRGGSQLLIGVDSSFIIEAQTRNLMDSLRTEFREAKLQRIQHQPGLCRGGINRPADNTGAGMAG